MLAGAQSSANILRRVPVLMSPLPPPPIDRSERDLVGAGAGVVCERRIPFRVTISSQDDRGEKPRA